MKEYVRQVLASQIDLSLNGPDFVPVTALPEDHRYFTFQKMANDAWVPSQEVIQRNIDTTGRDYRLPADGDHPIERLRARDRLPKRDLSTTGIAGSSN